MRTPLVLQITALEVVSAPELTRRIEAVGLLSPSARDAYAVQLRDPLSSGRALHRMAQRLRDLTRHCGVALVVNDRVDVAIAVGADGVHLGRRSLDPAEIRQALGAGLWISRSVHDLAEIDAAAAEGADALLLSPIFASPGKGQPLGLRALTEARAELERLAPAGRPALLALGGVSRERAARCLDAGADGVAAIRADLTVLLPALT